MVAVSTYRALLISLACILPGRAFHVNTLPNPRDFGHGLFMSSTVVDGAADVIKSTFQKPSKVLTVGLEYSGDSLSAMEISTLSMQLRKSKVTSIWCQSVENLKEFAQEQESAMGNFPGPCPVIYVGDLSRVSEAVDAGAAAIVYKCEDIDSVVSDCESIWSVSSAEEVSNIVESTDGKANVFLVEENDQMEETINSLPEKSIWIASIKEPMQVDGAEVKFGRDMKTKGCSSIFVQNACVGDAEDLDYTQFIVSGLTSKASSEFKFSGLTGSTNGHFGGVQASGTVNWKRSETKSE